MEVHLKIIGVLLIVLSLAHGVFPSYFDWKKDLSSLSLINREVMYVHTLFIAIGVFLMGILCLTSTQEILETKLGSQIALGFGVFWLIRFFVQFFGYSSQLWKGKLFETVVHIVFSVFWAYLSFVFLWISL